MRSPFRSKFRITQKFGKNPQYYSKFGLKAHEGIDIVPTGTVWAVYSLTDGVVVRDEDNPRSGSYGIYVTIWSPKLNKAFQYCHLASNTVKVGDRVLQEQKIGVMGSSGNTSGAHLHLNLFETDTNGIRLNRNNGYLGGIDPVPFMESDPWGDDTMDQEIIDRADSFIAVADKLKVSANKDLILTEIDKLLQLEDIVRKKDEEIAQKDKQIEEVQEQAATLSEEVQRLQKKYEQLSKDDEERKKSLEEYAHDVERLSQKVEELKKLEPIDRLGATDYLKLFFQSFWR